MCVCGCQTTSVIMEAVDFMDSMTHFKEPPSPPRLTRQLSKEETAYKPLRAVSGLRLAEVAALKEEEKGEEEEEKGEEEEESDFEGGSLEDDSDGDSVLEEGGVGGGGGGEGEGDMLDTGADDNNTI
jgi:hypothetical protein